MMFRTIILCLAMLFAFAKSSQAIEDPNLIGDRQELVAHFMDLARVNIRLAKLADGTIVGSDRAHESKSPIIPFEDGKRVVNRGFLTAMAEFCSLDWNQKSYVPFMATERARRTWSDMQTSYIGMLHGISQGWFLRGLEKRGNCSEDKREHTRALLELSR